MAGLPCLSACSDKWFFAVELGFEVFAFFTGVRGSFFASLCRFFKNVLYLKLFFHKKHNLRLKFCKLPKKLLLTF